jgi:hypothetical protein
MIRLPRFVEVDNELIPMPARRSNQVYPWDTMKVRQSFLVRDHLGKCDPSSVHSLCSKANIRYAPMQFRARKTRDGYRIWRVK